MDYWAEDKASIIENESIKKGFETVKTEINSVYGPKFYKKFLLNSMNESLERKDNESIKNLHRYFDYNLNFIDLHQSKPMHPVKIH